MANRAAFFVALFLVGSCAESPSRLPGGGDAGGGKDLGTSAVPPDHLEPDPPADLAGITTPFNPDASCASATETAVVEFLPVDIIWMIDNSSSMKPAIDEVTAGLNAFAQLIAGKSLDYKIIMLSLRSKTNPVTSGGSTRYGVCIPPPLSGGSNCENGPRFFQSSVDVKSTQPLEQILGTLGQTAGYAVGQDRGGEPWKAELRANATKTFVVVTDDNSRLAAADFETFGGGKNPFNSNMLPPGILDASWSGLFTGYPVSPSTRCTYPDGTQPPSAGPTYTDLVNKTTGVRAKICDGASSWSGFFASVAQAVSKASKLSCNLAIPMPSQGTLDPSAINVGIASPGGSTTLGKVANQAACGPAGGWYYDDDTNPTHVLLCKTSCDVAQTKVQTGASIQIQFGCKTIIQ
jgi:hypothetical protein